MKNEQIHFSKFEIYMAQSIHGFGTLQWYCRKCWHPYITDQRISSLLLKDMIILLAGGAKLSSDYSLRPIRHSNETY